MLRCIFSSILVAFFFSCTPKKDKPLTGRWMMYEMTGPQNPHGMEAELVYYHLENTMKPVADSMGRSLTPADTLKARLLINPALQEKLKDAWIEFSGDGHFTWNIQAGTFSKGHYTIVADSNKVEMVTDENTPADKTKLPYTQNFYYYFRNDSLKMESIDYNENYFFTKRKQK